MAVAVPERHHTPDDLLAQPGGRHLEFVDGEWAGAVVLPGFTGPLRDLFGGE